MGYVTITTNTVTMNSDSARLKHNHRDPETIKIEIQNDPDRDFGDISLDKVLYTLIDDNHKTYESVVNDLFKEANALRNEAQIKMRHKERCHNTYCSSWKANKKTKSDSPVMEIIVQVGGTYDANKEYATGKVDPVVGEKIMNEFVNQFIDRYPLLKVIDVTYHQGEATPHIHLDFVPVAKDDKYGLTASLDKACEQMGFGEPSKSNPSKTVFHIKHFEHDFHKLLDDICLDKGIEIVHPGLSRNHETVREYRENEKLRQENSQLKRENKSLEYKNTSLSDSIEANTDTILDQNWEIGIANEKLSIMNVKIYETRENSNKLDEDLKKKIKLQEELKTSISNLNTDIEEKKEILETMNAKQYASDVFITFSDKVNECLDKMDFHPLKAEQKTYSKDDFKKQPLGNGYIVPENALNILLRNQNNFRALKKTVEDLFDNLKSYINNAFKRINDDLTRRESRVAMMESQIEPEYNKAIQLEVDYKNLLENLEREIRHEAYNQAKTKIEEILGEPAINTKGDRAIKYLGKIGYLDDFERTERIRKEKLLNISW